MSEKKIGIALSGGGVKGAAHLGMLKVLEEANIKVDYIAGCSSGALMGSLYSLGYKAEEILGYFKKTSLKSYSKLTLSKPGIMDILKFRKLLEPYFQGRQFDDLDIPLIVLTTDMVNGRLVKHERGNLLDTVLASCAFPGVFSPVTIDNEIHMDGGILCNMPVTPLQEKCDFVIGSFVCGAGTSNPKRLNNSYRIFLRSAQLLLEQSSKPELEKSDFLFRPEDTKYVGFYDMRKIEATYRIGYNHAKENIDALLGLLKQKSHPF